MKYRTRTYYTDSQKALMWERWKRVRPFTRSPDCSIGIMEQVQRFFATFPPLHTPQAEALGFCNDGTVDVLVRRAVAG